LRYFDHTKDDRDVEKNAYDWNVDHNDDCDADHDDDCNVYHNDDCNVYHNDDCNVNHNDDCNVDHNDDCNVDHNYYHVDRNNKNPRWQWSKFLTGLYNEFAVINCM
jgi:hypothetical protein